MDTLNQPISESLVHVINTRLNTLHDDVFDIKSVLRDLTVAVTKLAVLDERQGQASLAQERAFKALERIEVRLDIVERSAPANCEARLVALEKAQPLQTQTSDWVGKVVVGAVVVVIIFVLKNVGLM